MKITPAIRSTVVEGMRKKEASRGWLADAIGVHPSWVSRFFSEKLKSLTDEQADRLESVLDVKFSGRRGGVSDAALEVAKAYDTNGDFARLVDALKETLVDKNYPTYIPPKEMGSVGKEIVRIAHAYYDKPGKCARAVMEMLSQRKED